MQVHKDDNFSMKVVYTKLHLTVFTIEPVNSLRIYYARECC